MSSARKLLFCLGAAVLLVVQEGLKAFPGLPERPLFPVTLVIVFTGQPV